MEFETETPHNFVKNEEQYGGMEQCRRKKSLVQPREEVSSDDDVGKKLMDNDLVMNNLGV